MTTMARRTGQRSGSWLLCTARDRCLDCGTNAASPGPAGLLRLRTAPAG